jgi:hypothetical protein
MSRDPALRADRGWPIAPEAPVAPMPDAWRAGALPVASMRDAWGAGALPVAPMLDA